MKLIPQSQLAWQVLVSAAANRQTLTYGMLAEKIGRHYRHMGEVLDPIYYYCEQQGLPMLTILVVNAATGRPTGATGEWGDIMANTAKVFEEKWFQKTPPGAGDLQAAMQKREE